MATHPLVMQLQFARREFQRCLQDLSAADAQRRLEPMNCISWMVGHLADQENRYWVRLAQGIELLPELEELVGYGRPASQPPLAQMWDAWQTVTQTADTFLLMLTTEQLQTHMEWQGKAVRESTGTMLLRNIYHYWFHTGEAHAVRQQLGHPDLPQFVGNMRDAAYRPEQDS